MAYYSEIPAQKSQSLGTFDSNSFFKDACLLFLFFWGRSLKATNYPPAEKPSGSAFFFFFFLYNETWNLVRPVSDFACMHTSPHTSSPTPTSFSAPPGFRLEPVSVVRCHRERQRDTGDRGRCVEHEQSLFTRLWVKFCGFFKCLKAKKIKCKHMNQSNINNLTNPARPFKCCRTPFTSCTRLMSQ